ncbi:modification methylase HgiDII [Streptococcus sanguinis SK1 = NCTC 7863]|jgi:DNA (cytosine-5-)-methyltransferase|uniref:Cytosine-specific methyltransferase n=1 Tax=Streptococcus sanguinis SK405 TaxID=888817 RepID=A0ABC9PF77_STRSA|nr:DNA cytosine methyltransferase [Streptococcus sanguinis]EGC25549.1 DNA (cytosine-5-)-methyltransferase [Streptococcus sanguinis SK405]EGC26971.1 DNA (cytosine-5-)-methyltransferase [Streptococcus sanguinis SK678]EGF09220.1 modification methylase HgiDII [Streptococcus sanguinis SK1 = NCTC 7863]MBF1700100.1 DNA cytosine methyltransferase [Streptococcus sanguinis]MBF1701994.1 DNA cytosine methyltransferase [Streptococcus sanguinis]
MKINAIDLFCGVGGLTYGVQQAGINVVAGYDIDDKSKFAYEYNNDAKFILKDIKEIEDDEILALYPKDTDIKILIGCAPCQPFSSYSHKYQNNENTLKKIDLLDYFGKQIELVQPDIVSMENVPQMEKREVFQRFRTLLEKNGYKVTFKVVYAPEYGVPQMRKRLLLLASKLGDISLLEPEFNSESYPTLRDAIENLPKIKAGETYAKDPLHRSRNMSTLNLKRIQQSKPGGTWRDWDEDLLLEAYKKESGQSFGSVYGRLEWDKPANTITTQFPGIGNGRFGHPEQDRALSLREGALLQTFPSNYQFVSPKQGGNYPIGQVALQIGNAVPPKLGEIIGRSIIKHLEELDEF